MRYFRPLNSSRPFDRLLEPAERLGRHRAVEEADQIELQDVADQLVVERLAAAVLDPAEEAVGVPAERRRGAEQRERLVLAVPVGAHAMAAVENAGIDRVLHLERRDDGAGRQHVELQPAARHLVDLRRHSRRRTRGRCPWSARCSGTSGHLVCARATCGAASAAVAAGRAGPDLLQELATIRLRVRLRLADACDFCLLIVFLPSWRVCFEQYRLSVPRVAAPRRRAASVALGYSGIQG